MNLTGPRNLTLCNCNLYGVRFKYIFAFLVVHFQKLFFFFYELHIFVKKIMSQKCKFCCRKKDKCQQKKFFEESNRCGEDCWRVPQYQASQKLRGWSTWPKMIFAAPIQQWVCEEKKQLNHLDRFFKNFEQRTRKDLVMD